MHDDTIVFLVFVGFAFCLGCLFTLTFMNESSIIISQGGAEYVQLQAISKWDGKLPMVSSSGILPFLNIPFYGGNSTL